MTVDLSPRSIFAIESLAEKHSNSFPGYDLIYFFEAGFPVYKVNLRVSMLHERALPMVSEFVLKLMDAGVNTVEEIAQWLGIPETQVYAHAADLLRGEYIRQIQGGGLELTDKGRNALNSLKLKVPQATGLPIIIDGMTGEMDGWTNGLYRRDSVKKSGMVALPPYEPRPTDANISFSDLKALVRKLQRNKIEHVPSGDLLDLIGIQKVYTEYRKMQVLVFQERNGADFELLVFERNHRLREHEQSLKRLERAGVRVVPSVSVDHLLQGQNQTFTGVDIAAASQVTARLVDIRAEIKAVTQRLEVERSFDQRPTSIDSPSELRGRITELEDRLIQLEQELSDLDTEFRLVRPFEQSTLLETALQNSVDTVILISPKLNGPDQEHLFSNLESALQRGVRVYLGFGSDPFRKDPSPEYHPATLARIQAITKKQYGPNLFVQQLDTLHERVVISDTRFYSVCPFGLGYFQANPQRAIRMEVGVYCGDTEKVADYRDQQLSRFSQP